MLKTSIKILFAFLILLSPVAAQNKTTLKLNLVTKSLPFGLTEQVPANIPKIGLALSGGGARSISQLGVLRAFEEAQIPIDIIVGTSMGGVRLRLDKGMPLQARLLDSTKPRLVLKDNFVVDAP